MSSKLRVGSILGYEVEWLIGIKGFGALANLGGLGVFRLRFWARGLGFEKGVGYRQFWA